MGDTMDDFAGLIYRVQTMIAYGQSLGEIHSTLMGEKCISSEHAHLIIRAAWDAGASKPAKG